MVFIHISQELFNNIDILIDIISMAMVALNDNLIKTIIKKQKLQCEYIMHAYLKSNAIPILLNKP